MVDGLRSERTPVAAWKGGKGFLGYFLVCVRLLLARVSPVHLSMEAPKTTPAAASANKPLIKSNHLHLLLVKDLVSKIQEILKAHSPSIEATAGKYLIYFFKINLS